MEVVSVSIGVVNVVSDGVCAEEAVRKYFYGLIFGRFA